MPGKTSPSVHVVHIVVSIQPRLNQCLVNSKGISQGSFQTYVVRIITSTRNDSVAVALSFPLQRPP